MSPSQKLLEAAKRSLPDLPGELLDQIVSTLPWAAAAWAASQFTGLGEIIDAVALVFLGINAVRAARGLYSYWTIASNAKTEADLQRAGQELAAVIALIGVTGVLMMLGSSKGKSKGGEKGPGEKGPGRPETGRKGPTAEEEEAPLKPGSTQEKPMLSTGANRGVDPTPESIRQGTVRMEEHPEYGGTLESLKAKGYEVKIEERDPYVSVREVVNAAGERVRLVRSIILRKGMRFLDLEHELGHVEQAERFPGKLVTERVTEDGKPYTGPAGENVLNAARDTVTEYHNRLVEYLRLRERRVDPKILEEHARGVREARDAFWKKGMKGGRSESAEKWVNEHFPDLRDLEAKFFAGGQDPKGSP